VSTLEGLAQQNLTKSCPQGGVLSPFLYSLFIDDFLTDKYIECDLKQGFADDLAIGIQSKNRSYLANRMNRLLKYATDWAAKWKIEFNIQKTKAVLFSRSRNKEKIKLSMNSSPVEMVTDFRYLGIVFDQKLLWNKHIEQQCGKALSLLIKLKAVTKNAWGLPQHTNWFIYKRVVEPILLYGCPVWSKALEKTRIVNLLRRVQRFAALSITGALRTTSTAALLVLANLKPINLLAMERSGIEFIKITQQNTLSNMTDIHNQLNAHNCTHKHDSSLQYMQRTAIDLAKYNITTTPRQTPTVPPWDIAEYQIIINQQSPPVPHEEPMFIYYTDASQLCIGSPVGIGVVLYQEPGVFVEVSKRRLPGSASVFLGELFAISESLQHALDIGLKQVDVCIYSDSRSSLELLKQFDTAHPLANKIHLQIQNIVKQKLCSVKLFWVKGHSGVLGNEAADTLAKQAVIDGLEIDSMNDVISGQYYRSKIRTKVDEMWQNEWHTASNGRFTFGLIPQVTSLTAQELVKGLGNQSRSYIYQALSGHIPLNDYLYRFHLHSNQKCDACGAEVENITHLLTTCPRFSLTRFMFLTERNLHPSDMRLSDYFKQWAVPLTLKIIQTRLRK
jgi:ribonuclease HI